MDWRIEAQKEREKIAVFRQKSQQEFLKSMQNMLERSKELVRRSDEVIRKHAARNPNLYDTPEFKKWLT